jgi:arylsulfatase A-like enzyme
MIWEEWEDHLADGKDLHSEAWESAGISRSAYWSTMQGFYDEAMAHNDYQLGRLVERLRATGEWENTLLIIAADHSIRAAMQDMCLPGRDPLPPEWSFRIGGIQPRSNPMLRPSVSRVPLIFVWPGRIPGGQWFSEPVVSMIDVLPTVLDLVGLPQPEIMQGQSLAPLLLGRGGIEPRPVILDEFYWDQEFGVFRGLIEVIDGRWGASLEINADPDHPPEHQRPTPLLLYDLWNDPCCLAPVNQERLDLVEKYTAFLEEQFKAHLALGQYFTATEEVVLTPEQLEMLRTLGYIR